MSRVRGMLERVRRLEQLRARPSPIEVMWGSFSEFESNAQKQIDAGNLCPQDMPHVLGALRRWHEDGVWQSWTRIGQVWRQG